MRVSAMFRYDEIGPMREMCRAEGWVLARRPGCIPFAVSARKWDAMSRNAGGVVRP